MAAKKRARTTKKAKKAAATRAAGKRRAAPATVKRSGGAGRRATAKTTRPGRRQTGSAPRRRQPRVSDEALLGPPPREVTIIRRDVERAAQRELETYTSTGPELTGGDPDADWQRAASVGEEAVGGTVATPDQDVVDEIGGALGVPRAPDEALRTSQEILEARDRNRWSQEG